MKMKKNENESGSVAELRFTLKIPFLINVLSALINPRLRLCALKSNQLGLHLSLFWLGGGLVSSSE